MARKVLTNAEMQVIIQSGGSVLINCRTHTVLATTIEQLPDDNEILECFPLTPRPAFDEDDLNANAIGILGSFFSGTPADGDSIRYNATTDVWEFSPLGISGTVGVTSGGTGLSSIASNSILYAGTANTLASTSLGSTLAVSSNTLNVVSDSVVQKIELSGNGNLFGTRKRLNFTNGSNTTVTVTDDPSNNRVNISYSASAVAGTQWDQLADPSGNLSLSHGSSNTVFTWGNATAGNSLFQLRDSNNNTGNGYILDVVSGNSSTVNLFKATASGNSDGVVIDNTGTLKTIGTGGIEASTLKGISGNGVVVKTSSGFVSRSVVSGSPDLTVTNQDGIAGNISIGLGTSVVTGVSGETNLTGNISGNILTLAWTGTLSKARQHASTVYRDQENTYVAGNKQFFVPNSVNAALNIGSVSGDPSALTNGDMWLDSMTGKIRAFENGVAYDVIQYLCKKKMLAGSGITTNLFEVELQNATGTAVVVDWAVHAYDGTNSQIRSGSLRFSAVNKAGGVVQEDYTSSEGISPSIGTLTVDIAVTPGTNKVVVSANATTSLTANNFYIKYYIKNLSEQTINIL